MRTAFLRLSNTVGDLRVTTKLMAAFGFMVVMTILVSFAGIHSAAMLNRSIKSLFSDDLSGISAIKEAAIFQVKCSRVLRDLVLANGDKDAIEDQKQILAELETSVDDWLNTAQQAFSDSESQAKLKQIKAQIQSLRTVSNSVAELALSGDQKGALAALKEANKLSNQVNLSIAEICRRREEAARNAQEQSERTYRRSRITMLGGTICSVLFAVGLCLLTVHMIARPLLHVMATLQKASNGDLTDRVKVENRDEVGCMGSALNEALESTRAVLQKVRETVVSLGAVSAELATTAEGMVAGAKTQAAAFEQTSASLEEITVTARSNAEHARQANEVVTHSHEVAQKGHNVVAAAVGAMTEIDESSKKISQVVGAVDEVAFQTNLLSVNAAIEAARAGEQGKSFGVVAEEIRNLSKRSAESARGIRRLIQDSLRTVKEGSTSINASGAALEHLSSSVNEVKSFVSQIVTSSQEQSVGVEEVHSAVMRMENVTHSNEAQASKLSSVATTLTDQASHLESMLNQFSLDSAN